MSPEEVRKLPYSRRKRMLMEKDKLEKTRAKRAGSKSRVKRY